MGASFRCSGFVLFGFSCDLLGRAGYGGRRVVVLFVTAVLRCFARCLSRSIPNPKLYLNLLKLIPHARVGAKLLSVLLLEPTRLKAKGYARVYPFRALFGV